MGTDIKAIRVHETGGPEVLNWTEVDRPEPGPGEAVVQLAAIGVNYVETYFRRGIYKMPVPFTPGAEGAGVVVAVGPEVDAIAVGDRVGSVSLGGSYAEYASAKASRLIRLPDTVPTEAAAGVLLQGLTAHYLCHDSYPIGEGETCLVHAGAGGVGRLVIQMAKMRGASVIATAGGPDKVALAASAGADHVIDYTATEFGQVVEELVGPKALAAVYDGVGAATFDRGLELLRPTGTMVVFGQASGVVPPFDVGRLSALGSLYITRPTLGTYVAADEDLHRRANDVLGWMAGGDLEVRIPHTWALAEAADAHVALEARQTTGKILLIP